MAATAIIGQGQATVANIQLSLQTWFISNIKTPYDAKVSALSLNDGMAYDPLTGKWNQDHLGLGIMICMPDDPAIWERVPTLCYCSDDGRSAKAPRPTGLGDNAIREWHPVTVCIAPALRVSTDGSTETDKLSLSYLQSFVLNSTSRTYAIPFYDREQPIMDGYAEVGTAYIEDFRPVRIAKAVQAGLVANRYRSEWEFMLRIDVETTNG